MYGPVRKANTHLFAWNEMLACQREWREESRTENAPDITRVLLQWPTGIGAQIVPHRIDGRRTYKKSLSMR